MKTYKYRARKSADELIEGTLTASTQDEAVEQINQMGLMPIEVDELQGVKEKKEKSQVPAAPVFRVKAKVLTVFYRQLARLLKSGIPLLRSLSLLGEQSESQGLKNVLRLIEADIREGATFSSSLALFGKVFNSFEVALIQAGESAGELDESLSRIVKFREAREALIGKVQSAMVYPGLIAMVGIGTVFFMLTFVIPKFSDFFLDLEQELPLLTRIMIGISHALQWGWIWLTLLLVFTIIAFQYSLKSSAGRLRWDQFVLRIPFFGKINLMAEEIQFMKTLELMIHSGIPLQKGIRIAIPVLHNRALQSELEKSATAVDEGGLLSDSLAQSHTFPPTVAHLLKVGEEAGKLEETLADLSGWYEEEINDVIKVMTQLIEPIMMLAIGLLVGLMIVAVLLPIFSLNAMIS